MLLEDSDHAESIELRHVQIEQGEVGPFAHDDRYGLAAGIGLADDPHVSESTQERREKRTGRAFVVRDHYPKRCGHPALLLARASVGADNGILTSTTVAPGEPASMRSAPFVP